MSNTAFKDFVKTPKGKLVLALGAMLLSWIFLLLNFSGSLMISMPSEKRKSEIKQQIRKLRTELKTLQEKQLQAEQRKKDFRELAVQSWQPSRDGDPELLLRQIVENAAKKSELKLNNLGTVRISRINQDFSFAELDVSATARLAPLINFANEIGKVRPALSWRRFTVFSMMRRPRNNNSRTVSSNQTDDNLNFSGSLRLLVCSRENIDPEPAASQNKPGVQNNKKNNGKPSASDQTQASRRGKNGR